MPVRISRQDSKLAYVVANWVDQVYSEQIYHVQPIHLHPLFQLHWTHEHATTYLSRQHPHFKRLL